ELTRLGFVWLHAGVFGAKTRGTVPLRPQRATRDAGCSDVPLSSKPSLGGVASAQEPARLHRLQPGVGGEPRCKPRVEAAQVPLSSWGGLVIAMRGSSPARTYPKPCPRTQSGRPLDVPEFVLNVRIQLLVSS